MFPLGESVPHGNRASQAISTAASSGDRATTPPRQPFSSRCVSICSVRVQPGQPALTRMFRRQSARRSRAITYTSAFCSTLTASSIRSGHPYSAHTFDFTADKYLNDNDTCMWSEERQKVPHEAHSALEIRVDGELRLAVDGEGRVLGEHGARVTDEHVHAAVGLRNKVKEHTDTGRLGDIQLVPYGLQALPRQLCTCTSAPRRVLACHDHVTRELLEQQPRYLSIESIISLVSSGRLVRKRIWFGGCSGMLVGATGAPPAATYIHQVTFLNCPLEDFIQSFFGFGQSAEVEIHLDGQDTRKTAEIKTEDGKKERHYLYYDGETVSGKVNVNLKKAGSKMEHQGIKIEFIGQIELYYDRGNHHEFTSLVKELARPGEMSQNTSFNFEFQQVEKPYESYTGANVRLRYFLRVTIVKRLSDYVKEQDIIVHTLSQYPDMNSSIKMEVGIEDCLHIEFEYNKSKYHLKDVIVGKIYFLLVRIKIRYMELAIVRREVTGAGIPKYYSFECCIKLPPVDLYHLKDVIVGKIYFLLVRIKIKHMEIQIIKRESTGTGPNTFNENETIAKYEIMDGAPVRGESIPIRLFLSGYELTPTMRDINKKFSVRYYLNLVLVDEEERRYFKQQEITIFRKADKVRKPMTQGHQTHRSMMQHASNPAREPVETPDQEKNSSDKEETE
ncbi:VP26B-like protein [Mya arenaria]|uniref:VP26B-like protein n=1 Tax=Mya arenaria TaxID=6604 RepID=A0ABY7E1J2_MYAAR|nr:VP26B-like protein [Mya arenaria]